ncbi:MAG: PSD1 and planctomycete cytochrome C domain-containing protein [Pirellulales bacterium]
MKVHTAYWPLFLALCALLSLPPAARADDALEFFEKKIRPVLVEHCGECHAASSKPLKGNLRVDSQPGLLRGGDTGPAVVPGDVEKSLLLKAVEYGGEFYDMPPKGKLPDAVIADIRKWIEIGAPDPRTAEPKAAASLSWPEILSARRDWWSLQPPVEPALPEVANPDWSVEPIDRFVWAALQAKSLTPNPPADRHAFIRRASLTLAGLPPTPAEVEAFVQDASSDCYATLIDRLLASPHFGERWARHWMDVIRFTETHGNEWNYEVHHAWRYRDYLIRAFNSDLPYDQFVREHIAGDLLPPRWNESQQINEAPIGTAFYRFGEVNHDDCIGLPQIGYDIADNQLDTLTKAFQGATVACARCHDHKLDAYSMHDYYGLLGIIRSSRLAAHTIDSPQVNQQPRKKLSDLKPAIRAEIAALWKQDAVELPRYLLAADAARRNAPDAASLAVGLDAPRLVRWLSAVRTDKPAAEHPLAPWIAVADAAVAGGDKLPAAWKQTADDWAAQERERREFNAANYVPFADFSAGAPPADWHSDGHGLRDAPSANGEFVLHHQGDAIVRAVLPAGWYSHALSSRLNGTLRSPQIPDGKQKISFQVLGLRSSALRLVSNNCQLNYANYKALTNEHLHWQMFTPPANRGSLRTFAELMTLLDNPKFPDQLSALGGDGENYRLPWDQALGDGRSFFGITRAVLHDVAEPPRAELTHLRPILAEPPIGKLDELAARYASTAMRAIDRFDSNTATEDDVRWLDYLLQSQLLTNDSASSPKLAELVAEYRRIESQEIQQPRVVPGLEDAGDGGDQPVFIRGDCLRPGELAERRYLEVLSRPGQPFASGGSGRLQLAQRIASADNPLTARVMVNRVWHYLFGAGIVRTVDDLGHLSDEPSHQELLDYLALRFAREGWSLKRLVREIALSQTFRQGSQPSESSREVDPQNRLLSHYPARRLEAEAIRDCILLASGRLDDSLYGPSIQPFREKEYADRRLFPGPLDGNGRRSVYIKTNLMESAKFLNAFNLPGGKVAQGRRDISNVPAQALALLNDPFVLQQAEEWAKRLVAEPDGDAATRVDRMFSQALGRQPSSDERQRFVRFVDQLAELSSVPRAEVMRSTAIWKDVAHAMFNVKEFIYVP